MRILTLFIMIMLFSSPLHAFVCTTDTGQSFHSGTEDIDNVPIDNDIFSVPNRINEFADVSNFVDCQNEIPDSYIDYLEVIGADEGIIFRDKPEVKTGVNIRGNYYLAPFNGKDIFVLRATHASEPLQIKLYLQINTKPTETVVIRKGDHLMSLHLHKYATRIGSSDKIDDMYFTWRFYAGNDVTVGTGTCDINNNQIIIVDFETVNASGISTVGSASRFQRNAEISYSCEDNNLTTPIKMTLSGDTATFSSDALLVRTGDIGSAGAIMPGLGVEVYHQGRRISPMNGSFNSEITNGQGKDTLMFALVKKQDLAKTDLIEGEFNSAATIIMSTP